MNRHSGPVVEFGHGETLAYRTSLENLRRAVPFASAMISTTLPRGGLQVVQPREVDANRMRHYVRDQHRCDAVAWQAMGQARPLRLSDVVAKEDHLRQVASEFAAGFLQPHGLGPYAVVPLQGPILSGFPGVLQLFRLDGQPDFTAEELQRLQHAAGELDAAVAQARQSRRRQQQTPLTHELTRRQLVCAANSKIVFPSARDDLMDRALEQNLLEIVEERLRRYMENSATPSPDAGEADDDPALDAGQQRGNTPDPTAARVHRAHDGARDDRASYGRDALGGTSAGPISGSNADRLLVPDAEGDNWVFRLAIYSSYRALTGTAEPVAFVSLQPECESWSDLRPSDFQADEEVARLIPALQYMQENFASGSSLGEIARTVHLSPFHFHRRFTELLGITPKHYLFDCQIAEAKRQLVKQEMGLMDIARHCGFAHQSHFTSRFKQATGLTPTKWRRLASQASRST